MNTISNEIIASANAAAVYNIYLCLAHKSSPADGEALRTITADLEKALKGATKTKWSGRDIYRLTVLRNAVDRSAALANSKIGNLTVSKSGLTACTFLSREGQAFVVFKGTGDGEWIDNGEGLSGIPEENTYITYGVDGKEISQKTVPRDYATDQQVEALNWFRRVVAQNGWGKNTETIITGHSKGGNKAQFVAINSDFPSTCYSFDGQGFSPEAIAALKSRLGTEFEIRRRRIYSLSADNDYVNVLGRRLAPKSNIHFFESALGLHYMEAILDISGRLHKECPQGKLSLYIEKISEELMRMRPEVRQYATLGIMNIFQQYLGAGTPVNGDAVSIEKTIAGIGVALVPFLRKIHRDIPIK